MGKDSKKASNTNTLKNSKHHKKQSKFNFTRQPRPLCKPKYSEFYQANTLKGFKSDLNRLLLLIANIINKQAVNSSSCFACRICKKAFNSSKRKPLCLPCGHTVCPKCLSTFQSSTIKGICPFDNKEFFRIIDSIPVNYALLEKDFQYFCREHNSAVLGVCRDDLSVVCEKTVFEHVKHNVFEVPSKEYNLEVLDRRTFLKSLSDLLVRCNNDLESLQTKSMPIPLLEFLRLSHQTFVKSLESYCEEVLFLNSDNTVHHEFFRNNQLIQNSAFEYVTKLFQISNKF